MLSDSDFLRSQKKLEARGKELLEKARQKAEKERLLAERQAARQRAREEEARQKRLAQLAAEEEVRTGRGRAGWRGRRPLLVHGMRFNCLADLVPDG
jgi:predicted Holliday junction resolvase-like endonuclease